VKCQLVAQWSWLADFQVDVRSRAVRLVKDQDLVKAITKVPQSVRRCWQLLKRQAKGWNCECHSQQGCFGGFANGIREIVVSLVNTWTLCWTAQCSRRRRCTRWGGTAFWMLIFTICSFFFPKDKIFFFCNILSLNLRLLWQLLRSFRSFGSTSYKEYAARWTDCHPRQWKVSRFSQRFSVLEHFQIQGCNMQH